MENDEKNDILITNQEIFKCDFEGQNVKNSPKYQTWEQSMKGIYGNNGKLFKCPQDKIYYYYTNEDCKRTYYLGSCPICKKSICHFCHTYCQDIYFENGSCCLKRKIKCMFLQDKLIYISQSKYHEDMFPYKKAFVIFFIPFLSFLNFIGRIQTSFFYKLSFTKDKLDENGNYITYANVLDHKDLIITINIFAAVLLTLPFFIINIYIIIIVWLFSFPIKLIPIRLFLGFIYGYFLFSW